MDYICHIWAGADHSSLYSFDRVEEHLLGFLGIIFRPTTPLLQTKLASLSLFYSYFHQKCSGEIQSLATSILTVKVEARHAWHIVANLLHSLRFPFVRYKVYSSSLFRYIVEPNPKRILPRSLHLTLSKSCVNRSTQHIYRLISYSVIPYVERLLTLLQFEEYNKNLWHWYGFVKAF